MLNPYLGANLMLLQKDGKFTIRNIYEQKKNYKNKCIRYICKDLNFYQTLSFFTILYNVCDYNNGVTFSLVYEKNKRRKLLNLLLMLILYFRYKYWSCRCYLVR